jgi:hypothetical protein
MSMRRLRIFALILVATVGVLVAVSVTQAAVNGDAAAKHTKMVKHSKAAKQVHGVRAPNLLTPAAGAHVQQMPALTWSAVSGAVEYQFEVAADPQFHSLIVVSASAGKGIPATDNLAASLEKPVTDGTYYWRVRGVNAAKRPGPWSATRKLIKSWTATPQLLGPAEGAEIKWPSTPLVLHWSEIPYAYEYIVTIATDEQLANVVVGAATSPVKTEANVYALPGTLQAGQTYYWAITPVDAIGHRGARSRVGSFKWSWPTTTTPSVTPLNYEPGETELKWTPEFTWTQIPGAARYQVEVSSAEGFPAGSTWCCSGSTIGTSASPALALNNNEYFWRVRAIDANGNTGLWNEGPRFKKAFDDTTPTIPDLTMSDINHNLLPDDPQTETPIVTWSPVPGAASYEVQVAPYERLGSYCNWIDPATFQTSTLAWTPLLEPSHKQSDWPSPQGKAFSPTPGATYCVQVIAVADKDAFGRTIVSAPTQLGGTGQPAFTFESRDKRCEAAKEDEGEGKQKAADEIYAKYELLTKATCEQLLDEEAEIVEEEEAGKLEVPLTPATDYILPKSSPPSPRTPLFTWHRVAGASAYVVVIARDKELTNVVDVAFTGETAYAPQLGGEEPLADETTDYYWAVVPLNRKGALPSKVLQNSPQTFNKSSIPPAPLSPVGDIEVINQPTFKWGPAEGALNYTLQVATNPTFANPIDDVRTDSTAYTSSSTYPANETLYWRVRANDTNTHHEGLNWSPVQTFKRTLPIPIPSSPSPTSTELIQPFSWSPVPGATSYDFHVEYPEGKTKDLQSESPVLTPTEWVGPGVWRWQVRAEFPTIASQTVAGSYFASQTVAHTVAPPREAAGIKSGSRIVISWNPQAYAKQYEVAISTNETFSPAIESHKITQTNWAPSKVDLTKAANKGTLYWRVAAVDTKGNVGPYATGSFVPPKPKCVVKKVKKGKKTVKVCVVSKHKPAKTKKKRG